MPVYEYKCGQCGEKFEARRGFFDRDKDMKCPKCGAKDARKVFSPFSSGSSANYCPPTRSTG